MFKKPTATVTDLETFFPQTDVQFCPDDSVIITGTSVKKGQGFGKLLFFDRYTLALKKEVGMFWCCVTPIFMPFLFPTEVNQSSVIRTLWHPKLNQIFVGCSDASVVGYYDDTVSKKGLLLSMVRKAKVKPVEAPIPESAIHLPNALLVEEDEYEQRMRSRTRVAADSFASRASEVAYQQFTPRGETELLKQVSAAKQQHKRNEDPREALLKYAQDAEENPMWVNHVYKKTQPKPIYDHYREPHEDERQVKRRK